MLELRSVKKTYLTGEEETIALDSVDLTFGDQEFVSILGASGSGKTTLLNIIGGLDQYTSGDMVVDGTSTKNFKDKEWDSYRNGVVGFVFQSYNLISHLTILDNVKMALSLSGISEKEAEARSIQALKDVGLEKHVKKKPNQLSGGQMQRVAIARALVNNPKILLADEPTGALDTKTSVQIMELIKKISKDKLVIMVTHNPKLAEEYSDRIIRVQDGHVIEDTNPVVNQDLQSYSGYKESKTSMSFLSAIKSSFKNLLTKKNRTIMVTLAGSIGIISIGLVLAISTGMKSYINTMQEENLSSMPITISSSQANSSAIPMPADELNNNQSEDDSTKIRRQSNDEIHQNIYSENILENDETFLEYLKSNAKDYYSSISYTSGYQLKVLTQNDDGDIQEVKKSSESSSSASPFSMGSAGSLFSELPTDKSLVLDQYKIVSSKEDNFEYPENANEIVLVLNSDNSISEETLRSLGYSSEKELDYKDLLGKTFKVIDNDNFYQKIPETSQFIPAQINEEMYESGTQVEIVAILKAKESTSSLISSNLAYTKALQDQLIKKEKSSEIVSYQESNLEQNVLSPSNEKIDNLVYTSVMQQLGGNSVPTSISVYPKSFDDRNNIVDVITNYNTEIKNQFGENSEEYESYIIKYTDMAKTMTEMMTTMINTITIVLTAFAAISLVVSSVMIGILTYVSVVERTKEIGIMRALGARKKDIKRIFIAEACLTGLISGLAGIAISYICTFPINNVIESIIGITGFESGLSPFYAIGLVFLSVGLTFIAGYLPSKIAARKDPVEALRTE
ncbi:ABC transporter ATP-binding protein/permease (plasmid) [Enterococcus mundtii]|uniref:ABC transporter ATP-binding protein/permease n=1 Tax=Enterococcus mundtii TaxID=53346 RepID=UPI00403C1800